MNITYTPNPLDTKKVELSAELLELIELLAKNTHEVWAKKRIEEGWKYGKVRNDKKKEHPGLVPYEELSEIEKKYDRNTVKETLKVTVWLGYRIIKNRADEI